MVKVTPSPPAGYVVVPGAWVRVHWPLPELYMWGVPWWHYVPWPQTYQPNHADVHGRVFAVPEAVAVQATLMA
jgi:hypothetical protein